MSFWTFFASASSVSSDDSDHTRKAERRSEVCWKVVPKRLKGTKVAGEADMIDGGFDGK
jgi:hypothetical protein